VTGQAGQNSLLGVFRPDRRPFFRGLVVVRDIWF